MSAMTREEFEGVLLDLIDIHLINGEDHKALLADYATLRGEVERLTKDNRGLMDSVLDIGLEAIAHSPECGEAFKTAGLMGVMKFIQRQLAAATQETGRLVDERDTYKRLYERGKALEAKACINCGYVPKIVKLAGTEAQKEG